MKYIKWFSDIKKEDIPTAGGKAANLGEMFDIGLPVPNGFIATAQAYKEFIEVTGLKERINGILNEVNIEDTEDLQKKSELIQEMIMNAPMPKPIKKEILEAYENLNVDNEVLRAIDKKTLSMIKVGRDNAFVAVRSSAVGEDLPGMSFAGQMTTYLNTKGQNDLIKAVQGCWASLFNARAIFYRIKNNFPNEKVLIAVVVQKQIDSDASGVMFTINPSTNNENEIVIESAFGLGEAIVSGQINPDFYLVDKKTLEIKEKQLKVQGSYIIRDPLTGKTIKKKLPAHLENKQVLSDHEIKKLAEYGIKLEKHYNIPQDVEFAVENKRIFIVQTRPVTTIKKQEEIGKVEKEVLLTGLAASSGIATGPIKILKDSSEMYKISKGDILVTHMTNPDFVPAMQRASAIVTDSGGLTCFSGNTIVLTNKGFKTIEETYDLMKDGNELFIFSYDYALFRPKWKKILSAGKRKRFAIRIGVSQKGNVLHNTLDITPDHKMYTYQNRILIKKELKSILRDEECLCLLDELPKLSIERKDEKFAYLVGALLSDGYFGVTLHKTGNPRRGRIVFTQKQTPEKEGFISTVKECFYDTFNEDFSLIRDKISNSLIRGRRISGVATDFICCKLEPTLKLLQISQNLDTWIMALNKESCFNFLAGLIDGDGCYFENRLHIYIAKENVLRGVIVACLKLGIVPQVSKNRTIHHVQIVEKISDILNYTKRVKANPSIRNIGTKFFAAKQILSDVIDEINWKGKIKPYVNNNLLLDINKLKNRVIPIASNKLKTQLNKIINSNLRMQRVSKLENLGFIEVFNLEVEANNDLDHNYVVFTKKYTPLLVSNSHASIVSRELSIPCVVGTINATKTLKDNQIVTVNGSEGKVYSGHETFEPEIQVEEKISGDASTITYVKVNCDMPESAEKASLTNADGVGLVRMEFMIAEKQKHPSYYLNNNKLEEYTELLKNGILKIAESFKEKPVWVRTSDIRSDEYNNLEGADDIKESNPMLGWHGIRKSLDQPKILKAEFEAIKQIHDSGYNNVGVMLPMIISVDEVRKAKDILREVGLEPQENIDFGVMIECPAAVQIIKELCEEGIDFISFGTNDLTQFTLAIDRNNSKVQELYNEMHPAVLRQIKYVIDVCKRYDVETSICGQAASNEEMAEFLVKAGIESISANIDSVKKIRNTVAKTEKKLLLGVARKGFKV